MYISTDSNFVFVDIAKTGSRSILDFLKKNYKGNETISHELMIPTQYNDYYKFTIVRDPYDRLASLWWSLCCRKGDRYNYRKKFEEVGLENNLVNFLLQLKENYRVGKHSRFKHTTPQFKYVEINDFNKIIKFENLNEDFQTLPFLTSKKSLPHINPTKTITKYNHKIRPDTDELMTSGAGEIISELCDKEFKMFGYTKRF